LLIDGQCFVDAAPTALLKHRRQLKEDEWMQRLQSELLCCVAAAI
jgi:hypothetical protein